MNLGDINVKEFGNKSDYLIKVEQKENSNNNLIAEIKDKLSNDLGSDIILEEWKM